MNRIAHSPGCILRPSRRDHCIEFAITLAKCVDMYVENICKLRAELEAELDQLKRVPPGRQRREFYDRMHWHKYLKTCPAITAQIRDQCDDDFTFPKLPDSLLAAPAPTIILSDDPSDFAGLT